jgi:hypothetical protein
MVDDDWRSEQRICRNAEDQQDWDHDRRNEIFHGPFRQKGLEFADADPRSRRPGYRRSGSQHAYEECHPKGEAAEQ